MSDVSQKLPGNQRIRHRQKITENLDAQFTKTKKFQVFEDGYISVQNTDKVLMVLCTLKKNTANYS